MPAIVAPKNVLYFWSLSDVDGRVDRWSGVLDDVGPNDLLLSGQDVDFNLGHSGAPDVVALWRVPAAEAPI